MPKTERTRGRKWLKTRALVLSREPLCVICKAEGRTAIAVEVDHIVPLNQGGSDRVANLQGLCREHHARKTVVERGDVWRWGSDAEGMPNDPSHHWARR